METPEVDFKALWAGRKTQEPALDDLMVRIDQYKSKRRRHLLLTNISLILTAVFILFVWYYFEPVLITTRIGIVVIVAAIALYVLALNKDKVLYKQTDESVTNQDYLKDLLMIKSRQRFVETTVLNLYFSLLLLGIGLYMYEYTLRMTAGWAAIAWGVTGLWIAFNWFYLRPMQIRKQQGRLNELIDQLRRIQSELNHP
ncbi:MAG: hypothetical protein K1X47_16535 [Cyclobacteriaceae bacterium]|nr:hypothetical protein [Cyclobacteriaceae bacterium]